MRRRTLLRTGALAATTASLSLAGCPRQEQAPEGSTLGEVAILNRDDSPRTVEFQVEWTGDQVHESTHELSAKDSATPSRTWPEDPGRFTVSARLPEGAWRTADPADRDYPDCYAVFPMVRNEQVTLWISTNSNECEGVGTESA